VAVCELLRVLVLVAADDFVRLSVAAPVTEALAPKLLLPVGESLPTPVALQLELAVALTSVAEGVNDGLAPNERLEVGDALAVNIVGVVEAVRLRGRTMLVSVREPLRVLVKDPVLEGVRLSDPGDRVPVPLGVLLSERVFDAD
jgi:hypothetical protein